MVYHSIVIGAVIGQDLSPVFEAIIARGFGHVLLTDYRLVDFYHNFRNFTICIVALNSSKIVVDLRLFFFFLLTHCFKYHHCSSQSIKKILFCRVCIMEILMIWEQTSFRSHL